MMDEHLTNEALINNQNDANHHRLSTKALSSHNSNPNDSESDLSMEEVNAKKMYGYGLGGGGGGGGSGHARGHSHNTGGGGGGLGAYGYNTSSHHHQPHHHHQHNNSNTTNSSSPNNNNNSLSNLSLDGYMRSPQVHTRRVSRLGATAPLAAVSVGIDNDVDDDEEVSVYSVQSSRSHRRASLSRSGGLPPPNMLQTKKNSRGLDEDGYEDDDDVGERKARARAARRASLKAGRRGSAGYGATNNNNLNLNGCNLMHPHHDPAALMLNSGHGRRKARRASMSGPMQFENSPVMAGGGGNGNGMVNYGHAGSAHGQHRGRGPRRASLSASTALYPGAMAPAFFMDPQQQQHAFLLSPTGHNVNTHSKRNARRASMSGAIHHGDLLLHARRGSFSGQAGGGVEGAEGMPVILPLPPNAHIVPLNDGSGASVVMMMPPQGMAQQQLQQQQGHHQHQQQHEGQASAAQQQQQQQTARASRGINPDIVARLNASRASIGADSTTFNDDDSQTTGNYNGYGYGYAVVAMGYGGPLQHSAPHLGYPHPLHHAHHQPPQRRLSTSSHNSRSSQRSSSSSHRRRGSNQVMPVVSSHSSRHHRQQQQQQKQQQRQRSDSGGSHDSLIMTEIHNSPAYVPPDSDLENSDDDEEDNNNRNQHHSSHGHRSGGDWNRSNSSMNAAMYGYGDTSPSPNHTYGYDSDANASRASQRSSFRRNSCLIRKDQQDNIAAAAASGSNNDLLLLPQPSNHGSGRGGGGGGVAPMEDVNYGYGPPQAGGTAASPADYGYDSEANGSTRSSRRRNSCLIRHPSGGGSGSEYTGSGAAVGGSAAESPSYDSDAGGSQVSTRSKRRNSCLIRPETGTAVGGETMDVLNKSINLLLPDRDLEEHDDEQLLHNVKPTCYQEPLNDLHNDSSISFNVSPEDMVDPNATFGYNQQHSRSGSTSPKPAAGRRSKSKNYFYDSEEISDTERSEDVSIASHIRSARRNSCLENAAHLHDDCLSGLLLRVGTGGAGAAGRSDLSDPNATDEEEIDVVAFNDLNDPDSLLSRSGYFANKNGANNNNNNKTRVHKPKSSSSGGMAAMALEPTTAAPTPEEQEDNELLFHNSRHSNNYHDKKSNDIAESKSKGSATGLSSAVEIIPLKSAPAKSDYSGGGGGGGETGWVRKTPFTTAHSPPTESHIKSIMRTSSHSKNPLKESVHCNWGEMDITSDSSSDVADSSEESFGASMYEDTKTYQEFDRYKQRARRRESLEGGALDMRELLDKPDGEKKRLHVPKFIPAEGCRNASDYIVRAFCARLRSGITVLKHNRSRWSKSQYRVLYLLPDGKSLTWKPMEGEKDKGKRPKLDLTLCKEVRHAWSHDPETKRHQGTAVLRKRCKDGMAAKSLALIFPKRTFDMTALSTDLCKVLLEGFSALCFRLQMDRLGPAGAVGEESGDLSIKSGENDADDDWASTVYGPESTVSVSITNTNTSAATLRTPWGL